MRSTKTDIIPLYPIGENNPDNDKLRLSAAQFNNSGNNSLIISILSSLDSSKLNTTSDPWAKRAKDLHVAGELLVPSSVYGVTTIAGYIRNEAGKIAVLAGGLDYKSVRDFSVYPDLIFDTWTTRRENRIVPVSYQTIRANKVETADAFDALPESLKQILISGRLPVTTQFPEVVEASIHTLLPDFRDFKTAKVQPHNDIQFALLMSTSPTDLNEGRTGVLLFNDRGYWRPVTVTLDQVEYLVEVKGCGMPSGGFSSEQYSRGQGERIRGGMTATQAEKEFLALSGRTNDHGPKPVLLTTFTNDEKKMEQGYVVRLTPSNIRASYTNSSAFPASTPKITRNIAERFATSLVEDMFQPIPAIVCCAAHPENLLLWGDGESCVTDFADRVILNHGSYPILDRMIGYASIRNVLAKTLPMVREIDGFVKDPENERSFVKEFIKALEDKGIHIDKSEGIAGIEELAKCIYEQFLAQLTLKERIEANFKPTGLIEQTNSFTKDVSLDKDFNECVRKIRDYYNWLNPSEIVSPESLAQTEFSIGEYTHLVMHPSLNQIHKIHEYAEQTGVTITNYVFEHGEKAFESTEKYLRELEELVSLTEARNIFKIPNETLAAIKEHVAAAKKDLDELMKRPITSSQDLLDVHEENREILRRNLFSHN